MGCKMAIENYVNGIKNWVALPILAGALALSTGCRRVNDPALQPERNLEVLIGEVYGATRNSKFNDAYRFDMREELNKMGSALELHENLQDAQLKEVIAFAKAKIFEQKGEYDRAAKEYEGIKSDKRLKQRAETYKPICLEFEAARTINVYKDLNSQLGEFNAKLENSRKLNEKYKGTEYEDNAKKLELDLGIQRVRFIAEHEDLLEKGAVETEYLKLIAQHNGSHLYDDLKIELAGHYESKADSYAKTFAGTNFRPNEYLALSNNAAKLYQDVIRRHPETNSYTVARKSLSALEEKRKDVLKNH